MAYSLRYHPDNRQRGARMGPAPSKGVWVSTTPVLSLSKDSTRPSQRQRP